MLLRAGGVGGLPGLLETEVVTKSTGVFQNQVAVNDQLQLHISGYAPRNLIPGMPLQDNIFNSRVHGFLSEFAIVLLLWGVVAQVFVRNRRGDSRRRTNSRNRNGDFL